MLHLTQQEYSCSALGYFGGFDRGQFWLLQRGLQMEAAAIPCPRALLQGLAAAQPQMALRFSGAMAKREFKQWETCG